ncbi:hypothetical protein LTR78_004227 [Recurvomyces mirabilis]|uniref:NmrA-like domain-containing protein n=1 Tax=Recurvomyces mirabilis TaxID=574656 RepID=A0AAE0WQH4_9PEZI|nr:hypothetical protein LTR78_004227 [Recurvomyces mirabilis]KAK5153603.1 hypothetical protein LTS14_007297 [Recurvomyces mirabilis]
MSSQPYMNIALAGATGNLGQPLLKALVEAKYNVTVLSRSTPSNLPSGVKVATVDFTSLSSLSSALQGIDAFVSCIPNHGDQPILIDAAVAAGVKHFIPSEFGSNVIGNANCAALPVFAGKKKTEEYLDKVQDKITWTAVITGAFLEFCIEHGLLINPKTGLGEVSKVYDGGDGKRSFTTYADICTAVIGVLRRPEQCKNRAVYVQSTTTSQNELLAIAKELKPERDWAREEVSTEDLLTDSYANLKEGGPNIGKAMVGFIIISIMNQGYGSCWDEENDNGLLGINGLSREELKKVVAGCL